MEIHEDERVREAAERCARLESWIQVERDQVERERLAEALQDARQELAKELDRVDRQKSLGNAGDTLAKGIENASQEIGGLLVPDGGGSSGSQIFPDGNVTDFLKQLDAAAAEKKAGRELAQQLEPSPDITELPEYKKLYAEALERLTALDASIMRGVADAEAGRTAPAGEVFDRLESKLEQELAADVDQYAEVQELQPGREIEGEVEAIVEREDQAFYIVKDHDDELAAVAVEKGGPEMEVGDDIEARRDNDGTYDVGPGYSYGR